MSLVNHSAALLANANLPCSHSGCEIRRHGYGSYCQEHAHQVMRKRSAIGKKAVATRRARNPQWGNACPARRCDAWSARAHATVELAIAQGILPSLAGGEYACADCGKSACDYDHRDYSRPLDVEPVCRSCNKLRGPAAYPRADRFQFTKLGAA